MSRIVAIGEEAKLAGYTLAGVELIDAVGDDRVRAAWEQLDDDVGLVLITPEASRSLAGERHGSRRLWVVLPA